MAHSHVHERTQKIDKLLTAGAPQLGIFWIAPGTRRKFGFQGWPPEQDRTHAWAPASMVGEGTPQSGPTGQVHAWCQGDPDRVARLRPFGHIRAAPPETPLPMSEYVLVWDLETIPDLACV